ncbi:FAD-dependent oxidoreductase [Methylobacterium terricola]|uniref:FAD-dependent oxidoreductase n=1 Tax=Methylobacterium terricola TaxID=2583531 RepID=A0A5C4L6E0_9HYPH|nr:FAD-dependent oxidoreductase [Methylobacterium terricola]TNC06427.1 FAD-dependent oxidoreductase [Methylobacterium terricola]
MADGTGPRLSFEGRAVAAAPGASIAAALTAAGILDLNAAKDGTARGPFCGMGVCHDCLVVVDGRAGIRACMTKVQDGMRVARQPALPEPGTALAAPPAAIPVVATDLLVIGAGPAGLAAAEAAARAGAAVTLLDERPAPGGQYFKQPATADAARGADAQSTAGRAAIARLHGLGATILADAPVWGAEREPDGALRLGAVVAGEARTFRPRLLVVATGAIEAAPILPGWTLPGVMTAGALQTLLRGDGVVPPGPVVIAGNGPLNLQVAAELLRRGGTVAAVIEAAEAPWRRPGQGLALLRAGPALAAAGLRQIAALRRAGVPLLFGARAVRVEGGTRVERVVVAAAGGGTRSFAAAFCALGEGFQAANDLPRLLGCRHEPDRRGGLATIRDAHGSTSLPDVLVAGEAGRFGGAALAGIQGALAGRAAARRLGLAVPGSDDALLRRGARARAFQDALWRLFAAPAPGLSRADDATILCRCEALTLGRIRDVATAADVRDVASLKRLTRAGMGRCQGRLCGEHLGPLVGADPGERAGFAPQMPLRPVPIAALAVEKPEWGGHRRSLLPDWTPAETGERVAREAEVAVIGAGIAGLSTALFLARAGRDVLVIERAEPNALASGGNAGSLHAQLLSFDHGARAEGGGGPAARTLPLQRDAIDLWLALARELGRDFEIGRTGGLMVAETERDLAFLAEKARIERRYGIDSAVISAAELRRREPALWEGFAGAAYCPQEGKINPLLATQGILEAARAAGARLLTRAAVTGITQQGAGFRIETSRGPVRAGRVVNAAGAFASVVGRMLDVDVPVHGAPLQMIVTEPTAPLVGHLVAHADRHLTLKQAKTGSLLIGGGWTAGLDPVHGHPRPLMASLEGNLWVAQHVVPALRGLRVVRSWAAMNINIDGAPILGEDPRRPGLFHAVTSNGYTLGPLVGRITAELMTRGDTDRDIAGFSVARFGGKGASS